MTRFGTCLCLFLAWGAQAFGLTADEQLRFADGIYLRGFYESAVGEYLVLLRDHPEGSHVPAVLYRTGECYRQMGNQAGAERFYKRAAEEFPGTAPALRSTLRRAESALAEGRTAAAQALLEDVRKGNPPPETAAAALYYLGLARKQGGDLTAATAAYGEVLERHGDSPHASYAALDLADLHAGDPKQERATEAWYEKAVETAATPSARAEALFRWGDWAYRRGRYSLAADVSQSLMVELPGERRARDAQLASAWSLYYLGRTGEAIAGVEKLLAGALDAETAASATYLRANCRRKESRDLDALLDYEPVAQRYPGTPFARRAAYETMVTHFQRGDAVKALASAPMEPEREHEADVLWMRAESERMLGRLDLARGRYESLVEQHSKSPQAPSSLLRLGEMAREAGRMEEASERFRQVARDYPRNEAVPDALQASALARMRAGDAEGALADWEVLLARKLDAGMAAEARLQKALTLIELKRGGEALAELDVLLKDRPGTEPVARAQYWRGVLLAEDARWEMAETALRACLAAGPEPQIEALARLRLVVVLQQQNRMDEAADQVDPLLEDAERVADNPALVEWAIRRRFDQEQYDLALKAATALARSAREASWKQIGWHWAGASQTRLGDEKAAIAAYEKAVAQKASTREGAESQLLLAGLELQAGRHEQAAARYAAAAAAALGEDSLDLRVRAYFGLGEAAEAAGEWERAARHYLSVAVLFDDPEWTPHSLFRAGGMFGKAGRTAEQSSAWKELKARYPESGFARQIGSTGP